MGSNTVATIDGDSKLNVIFSKYLNCPDSDISKFIKTIPSKFDEAISVLNEKPVPDVDEFVRLNRNLLKDVAVRFHTKADTFTKKVRYQIDALGDDRSKIYVGIHQPNLFAFSGVFKKIVLLEALANHSKRSNYNIIPLFLIVDHDFMDDKWMHIAKLPSIRNSTGVLDLRFPINNSKRWKISSKTEPPTRSLVNYWENQVYSWIKNSKDLSKEQVKALYNKFEKFWSLVEESFLVSTSYSEFNSIIMSKITNAVWDYETIFINLTELSKVFRRGYNFLLAENELYLNSLERSEAYFREHGIYTGVSANSNKHSSLWVHCDCGSKASSKISQNSNGELLLIGKCIACKRFLSLPIGRYPHIAIPDDKLNMVSPRAIPILLLLARELAISSYISGTGGSLGYTLVGKKVFDELRVNLPTMVLWAANDIYSGFAQKEASRYLSDNKITNISEFLININDKNDELRNKIIPLISKRNDIYKEEFHMANLLEELFSLKQEQRKIKELLKNVQKCKNALKLKSCIIDYAVNFGIENIEKEWSFKLVSNNELTKSVIIN